MTQANNPPRDPWIGKKVIFKIGDDHSDCWHTQVQIQSGIVLRAGQSLSEKAAMLAAEGLAFPDTLPEDSEVARLWIKVDPCSSFPRGCEVAVEKNCLVLRDS